MLEPNRRFRGRRPIAAGLLAGLLAAGSAGAIPERPGGAESEVRFAIETLEVEGLRHAAPALIVAEARLVEGERYAERDLRAALDRIRRLPFVLAARPALRRGSVPGRYRLVIEIEEANRFFFAHDLALTAAGEALALDGGDADRTWVRSAPLVGARFFVGRYDMVFASAGSASGLQLGYQRHGLFGRGGVLRLSAGRTDCCPTRVFGLGLDPAFGAWREEDGATELAAELGVPLAGNHALHLRLEHRRSDGGFFRDALPDVDPGAPASVLGGPDRFARFAFDDLERSTLALAWRYVTTDDPTFPTRGLSLSAGVDAETLEADGLRVGVVAEGAAIGPEASLPPTRARQLRARVTAERHWPLGGAHTASLGVRGALGRGRVENLSLAGGARTLAGLAAVAPEEDLTVWSASVSAGYSRDLLAHSRSLRWGELRWQSRLTWSRDGTSLTLPGFVDLETFELETGIALRNGWGLFRVVFRLVEIRDL